MKQIDWKNHALWQTKANIALWIINAVILSIFFVINVQTFQLLSKITLLETGIIFIAAGAIAFSGSVSANKTKEFLLKTNEQWSIDKLKTKEKNANKYLILATIVFLQSLVISLLGY